MISVDNKIKNIYYMLCYTFNENRLNAKDEEKLGVEAFENIYELFSTLLCLLLKGQLKQGVYKSYNYEELELKNVRGKINITDTIKNNSLINKRVYCEYDEFTTNVLMNRIIKTTLVYLIKSQKVTDRIKIQLKKLLAYYSNVDTIARTSIKWDMVRFDRNNNSYKNSILICKLILEELIVSDVKGNNLFKEFLDDTVISRIYENFLREYYKKHYPMLKAKSQILRFNEDSAVDLLPIMKTDITLEYNEKILVIDAKFYSHILSDTQYGSKVVSSGNLYQVLAYVDNLDPYKENKVVGMLLYAQTINEPIINKISVMNEHRMIIRTIDLSSEWIEIRKTLDEIALNFMDGLLIKE